MPLFRAFAVAATLLAAWLPAAASQAQGVPPLSAPDVTTLLAPPAGSASDLTTPSSGSGTDSGDPGGSNATDGADGSDSTPPPPCGTVQVMFLLGSLMSQVLQCTQFWALI